jgi:hypothetical protein
MWREWEGKEGGGGGVQDKRLGEPWQGHMPSVRPAVRTGIGQLSWGGAEGCSRARFPSGRCVATNLRQIGSQIDCRRQSHVG